MEVIVSRSRKESIDKTLEKISDTIGLHNKAVHTTNKESKYKFCFEWMIPIFILIGVALILLIPNPYKEGIAWISIATISIVYLITKKKYCEPYYQAKKDKAYGYSNSITNYEMELSDLIKHKITLHHKCFLWNESVFIGGGHMHQDDYYSELYGGRWTSYAIEIDGNNFSFNPYKDIVYT